MGGAVGVQGQSVCPLALTAGRFAEGGLRRSVRNKGKVPVQEFQLPCAPAAGGAGGGVCAEERGIFYPGTPYWVSVPYAGVGRRVTVTLRSAELAGGVVWTAGGEGERRALRVRRWWVADAGRGGWGGGLGWVVAVWRKQVCRFGCGLFCGPSPALIAE